MERINFKALLFGIAADMGGTFAASLIIFPMFAGDLFSQDMSPEEIEAAMQTLSQDSGFLLASLVVGLAFSALGGYVAARVAKKDIYLNAGLVGVFGLFIGLLFGGGGPIWFNVAGFVLVIPAALYGGFLADRQTTKVEPRK